MGGAGTKSGAPGADAPRRAGFCKDYRHSGWLHTASHQGVPQGIIPKCSHSFNTVAE